jgi:hypothetical protein
MGHSCDILQPLLHPEEHEEEQYLCEFSYSAMLALLHFLGWWREIKVLQEHTALATGQHRKPHK